MNEENNMADIAEKNENNDQLAERINREERERSDSLRKRIADIEKEATAYYNSGNFLRGDEKVEYKLVKIDRYRRIAEWVVALVIGYALSSYIHFL